MNIDKLNIFPFMRRSHILQFVIFLSLLSAIPYDANAQRPQLNANQVSVTGWVDDTHYKIRDFDSENNLLPGV